MAPIKFEDNIKDKLENRRLKPSADAWNKLSERLDNQDKKKNNKPVWLLGIAASIIGVFLVVSQFTNKVEDIEPVIVDSPEKIENKEIEPLFSSEKEQNEEASVDVKTNESSEYKKILKEKSVIINKININQPETAVAINKTKQEEKDIINNKPIEVIKEELSFEEQKIKDVVAKVNALKDDNVAVTDDDIDAL